jgi:DNA-binding NtrC family response regulator
MEKRRAILVVEGDEFIRRAIEKYCSSYAPTMSVSTARGAIKALDQDLVAVVLNIHPPDGSGLTVLEKIRERNPVVPVLIRTDGVIPGLDRLARQHGAELLGGSDSLTRLKDFISRAVRAHRASQPRLPVTELAEK